MAEGDLTKRLAYIRDVQSLTAGLLIRLVPTLAKQGVVNSSAIATIHDALLHLEGQDFLEEDQAQLRLWRENLERDAGLPAAK